MTFSIIIPAHDEERVIGACLAACREAAKPVAEPVELIVVLNRCSDRTERIASEAGAHIVREDRRNLSAVRNAGACAASGEILITVDADSRMSPRTLAEVERALVSAMILKVTFR